MTIIYHNPRCSKSRAALELLQMRDINHKVVHYLDTPPSTEELSHILSLLGIPAKDLARQGDTLYKELNLENQELSEAQWTALLIKHPKLIERPIIIHEGQAAIARPINNLLGIL